MEKPFPSIPPNGDPGQLVGAEGRAAIQDITGIGVLFAK
jgi:hypothetical protein